MLHRRDKCLRHRLKCKGSTTMKALMDTSIPGTAMKSVRTPWTTAVHRHGTATAIVLSMDILVEELAKIRDGSRGAIQQPVWVGPAAAAISSDRD